MSYWSDSVNSFGHSFQTTRSPENIYLFSPRAKAVLLNQRVSPLNDRYIAILMALRRFPISLNNIMDSAAYSWTAVLKPLYQAINCILSPSIHQTGEETVRHSVNVLGETATSVDRPCDRHKLWPQDQSTG